MALIRVIPVLLLQNNGLVKTKNFKEPKYIGDPLNAVKIFNEKEVDELIFLNIRATQLKTKTPLAYLEQIAGECFMPLSYGGGISTISDISEILRVGVEKVIINTAAVENINFIYEAVSKFGSSTICVSLDTKRNFGGKYEIYTRAGTVNSKVDLLSFIEEVDKAGAGELMITSIEKEGTMTGYDLEMIRKVTDKVSMPVIASGGAGNLQHFKEAVFNAGASAVAAGSFFVFRGRHRAVLITYPSLGELKNLFNE